MDIINKAAISSPDGIPLVWVSKKRGIKKIERCSGPDMMHELFVLSEKNRFTNYFYGGTDDTLNKLKTRLEAKYPNLKILGMYSPPFRPLSNNEDKKVIDEINALSPDFVWVGLGAPKQEIWMFEHVSKINRGVLLGVGAAFNFYSGTVKRAPKWMQVSGLEWLYRLIKEPMRLWKRYFTTNFLFIFYLMKSKIKHILKISR